MERETLRSDFSLERFARVYVREALRAAKKGLSTSNFRYYLMNVVSTTMGISHTQFRYLQDVFFSGLTIGDDAYISFFGPRDGRGVHLKRGYRGHEVQKTASRILRDKRGELETRVRLLRGEDFAVKPDFRVA